MGVGNDRVDDGESLVIDFDLAALPYGVENLTLTMNQFGGGEAVDITVYDIDGITVLGSFTHPASSGSAIDLSTFNGIGSVQIENNSGGNSTLRFADYDPAPAPASSITPAGEDNGSNLTWVYGYETDLDGNGFTRPRLRIRTMVRNSSCVVTAFTVLRPIKPVLLQTSRWIPRHRLI